MMRRLAGCGKEGGGDPMMAGLLGITGIVQERRKRERRRLIFSLSWERPVVGLAFEPH